MPKFLTWWWVRLLIGIVVVIASVILASVLSTVVAGFLDGVTGDDLYYERLTNDDPVDDPLFHAVLVAALSLVGYALHLRFVERRPRLDIGLGRGVLGGAGAELGAGLLIGLGLMAAVALVLSLAGAYEVVAVNPLSAIAPGLMIGILAGFTEEILLRGLVFRLVEDWMGSVLALVVSSLLFGFLHAANANATLFSSIAISLEAGVLFGLAYMFTRRLWLVIGIHVAWNTALGGVFGLPVSGYAMSSILESRVVGPDWLTGGAFGPEASVTALAVCSVAIVAFAWAVTRRGEWRAPAWRRGSEATVPAGPH